MMGIVPNVSYDTFPAQGRLLHAVVLVSFNYEGRAREWQGVCVRDDLETPHRTIFRLDDGRYVLSSECQWREKP